MASVILCVIILVLGTVEAIKIKTATITPQEKTVEDLTSRRFTDYDSYQYQGFVGSPIIDVLKTILLAQEMSKKHTLHYDEDGDYKDDDIVSDIILLESLVLDNPLDIVLNDNSYSGSVYVDSLLLDSDLKMKKSRKNLLKKSKIRRPKLQKSLDAYQRRKLLRELKQLLKMLLPLVKESGLPMRARVQVDRRRGNEDKQ